MYTPKVPGVAQRIYIGRSDLSLSNDKNIHFSPLDQFLGVDIKDHCVIQCLWSHEFGPALIVCFILKMIDVLFLMTVAECILMFT